MKQSRIDRLLRSSSWKGACARVTLVVLVYLGLVYLPQAMAWGSKHWGLTPMSARQVASHGTIVSIYRVAFIIALSIEAIGWGVVAVRKYRQGRNQPKRHV